MQISSKLIIGSFCALLILLGSIPVTGQNTAVLDNGGKSSTVADSSRTGLTEVSRSEKTQPNNTERINALEDELRQQARQLDELRRLLVEQQATIKLLAGRVAGDDTATTPGVPGTA